MQSIELLDELGSRAARARARASAGWLPMLLTGLAMLGSFPAQAGWWDGPGCRDCNLYGSGGSPDVLAQLGGGSEPLALYWLTVIPLLHLLTSLWFVRTRRRTGFRKRWELHVLVALAVMLLLLLSALPPFDSVVPAAARPVLTPLLALAVGLLVLSGVERDRMLALGGAAVLGVAVVVAALADHVTSLPDSGLGNVGQALLAPSVQVGGVGIALIVASLLLRAARRRAAATPVAALPTEHP